MKKDSQYFIDRGYIDVDDDAEFRTMADAASCFGKNYKGLQRSYIPHPSEANKRLWFPKFYENDKWNNQISDDENTITQIFDLSDESRKHIDWVMKESEKSYSRIVFGRVENSSGNLIYCFKGKYRIDLKATNYQDGLVYKRIATRAKTYPSK